VEKEVPPQLRWIVRYFTKIDEVIDLLVRMEKRQIELLEIIAGKPLPAVPAPPAAPPRIVLPPIPAAPVEWKPVTDRLDKLLEGLGVVGGDLKDVKADLVAMLFRAKDYHVETLDLGTERTDMEFTALQGFALTVFKCTGTIGLKFNAKNSDKITIEALTYPQTLLIDWFDFTKVYVTNTAQSDLSATLISWKR